MTAGPFRSASGICELASAPESTSIESLHRLLVLGNVEATEQLTAALLSPLERDIRRAFPRVPRDVLATAAEDALLEYTMHPQMFDPTRGVPIERFLKFAACRNVMNLVQSEARRKARERAYIQEALWTRAHREREGASIDRLAAIRRILAVTNVGPERAAVRRWLNGDQSSDGIAATLGLVNLNSRQRREEVKRFKDRILKRLKRSVTQTNA